MVGNNSDTFGVYPISTLLGPTGPRFTIEVENPPFVDLFS